MKDLSSVVFLGIYWCNYYLQIIFQISPESGTALETVFRFSTRAAVDKDSPLQYSFYCSANNDTILLASYTEHRAAETFLPYIGIFFYRDYANFYSVKLYYVKASPNDG